MRQSKGNCDTNDTAGARVSVLTIRNCLIYVTRSIWRCLRAIGRLKFASRRSISLVFVTYQVFHEFSQGENTRQQMGCDDLILLKCAMYCDI